MNDLDFGADLRTALHRDADLVGAPAPDLLDQLVSRRRHQRRQRMALMGAVVAVVVIAAGIPVGVALAARSDVGPATRPAPPPPSVSRDVTPTTAAAPTTEFQSAREAEAAESAAAAALAALAAARAGGPPGCLDSATARALLPADTASEQYSLTKAPTCAGVWAVAFPRHSGSEGVSTFTQLYHWVGGAWQLESMDRADACPSGQLPDSIYQLACETN